MSKLNLCSIYQTYSLQVGTPQSFVDGALGIEKKKSDQMTSENVVLNRGKCIHVNNPLESKLIRRHQYENNPAHFGKPFNYTLNGSCIMFLLILIQGIWKNLY